MKIMAIDPGPAESAVVLWDAVQEKVLWSEYGKNQDLFIRLRTVEVIDVNVAVIEWVVNYGKTVGAAVFETCYWAGRLAERLMYHGLPVELLDRKEVKLNLLGTHQGGNSQVIRALKDRYGEKHIKGPVYDDKGDMVLYLRGKKQGEPKMKSYLNAHYGDITGHEWQAFALAVTYWDLK